MIRIAFFTLIFLIGSIQVNAQTMTPDSKHSPVHPVKAFIDSSVYSRWTHVEGAHITNNGKFASYIIRNDSMINDYATILTDDSAKWIVRLPGVNNLEFTGDSRMAVFMNRDTLFILNLGGNYFDKISNVTMFFVSDKLNGEWVAFKNNSSDSLIVYNVRSGKKNIYSAISGSYFSEDGKALVLQGEDSVSKSQSLSFLELSTGKIFHAWTGQGLISMQLNSSATQAVLVLLTKDKSSKSIWFYERGKPGLNLLVNNEILGMDSSFVLDDYTKISSNGKYVSFSAKRMKQVFVNLESKNSTVNVWSYLDPKLQSLQLTAGEQMTIYPFVINCQNHQITQLCKDNETVMSVNSDDDIYVVEHISGDADGFEASWNPSAQRTYYLKSIKENSNVLLNMKGFHIVVVSPEGKYIIYYNREKSSYFSYEVASRIYRNITLGMNIAWHSYYREDASRDARGICGWGSNDAWVLIYDKFDIWKIDPLGKVKPVNVTNGYGLRNSIIFDLAFPESYGRTFSDSDVLILNAVNIQNKQNGFFQKKMNKNSDPDLLTMGNYIYQLINNPYVYKGGAFPIRAKKASTCIVTRMSANESPNYFLTNDFKQFKQLSYVCPEKKFNWFNTELHTWRRSDGTIGQGVLYKPENFDSSRKYPVIFHYYEKMSFSLNEYLTPQNLVSGCNIDIPTYVSNGYIVFTPDIDYVIGDPMQGTLDAVVSAANYVSQLPFIASKKMGIGGCSFGGLQTNYLITHSNLFAAAYSASSLSDLVSAYDDVPMRYGSSQNYFEEGQGRMGAPLWDAPEKYVKNSPIFNADKVTTPLLLMHTTQDAACSFSQALELYTALRRLGKRVWLLEYTDGNHGVFGKSGDDYALRLRQFFDHYLMGKTAPQWMTRGIPARLKGIDNGFNLDSSIETPGKGLLIGSGVGQ